MNGTTFSKRNIVITAAHPDDTVAMGGTALLLKDRYKLHVLCMTRGERGIKGKTMEETAAIREEEERAACRLLDADVTFMGEIDQEVFAGRAICERTAAILKELDPLAVFTLWPLNVPDHAAVYQITMQALHMADLFFTTEFYLYETSPGGQTNDFTPDIHVNIDQTFEDKMQLMRCHKSQYSNIPENAADSPSSRFRGTLARCERAEGFKMPWPLMAWRWGRKMNRLLLDL